VFAKLSELGTVQISPVQPVGQLELTWAEAGLLERIVASMKKPSRRREVFKVRDPMDVNPPKLDVSM
jgi:hypothetical protein